MHKDNYVETFRDKSAGLCACRHENTANALQRLGRAIILGDAAPLKSCANVCFDVTQLIRRGKME